MFAAHVLHHADVAAIEHGIIRDIIAVEQCIQTSADILGDPGTRAIRCAAQEDRGAVRAARNEDDGLAA